MATIVGTGGSEMLVGGAEWDSISGGAGADTLMGGNGDDRIHSGEATSHSFDSRFHDERPTGLDVDGDADLIFGGAGNDLIFAGWRDSVDGGSWQVAGNKLSISFMAAGRGVHADFRLQHAGGAIDVDGGIITSIQSVEWLEGSHFGDFLAPVGNVYSGYASVFGRGGDDQIVASRFTRFIDGGEGDDSIEGSPAADSVLIRGGGGHDVIAGFAAGLDGGAGDDVITGDNVIFGGSGNDTIRGNATVFAGPGDDTIQDGFLRQSIDGGEGIDQVLFMGSMAGFELGREGDAVVVRPSRGGVGGEPGDRLTGVERIRFEDFSVAYDVDGAAGTAWRLYKAALGRLPDLTGLGFQIHDLDNAHSLRQVAANFLASPEFQAAHGNMGDEQFVRLLYRQALERDPEAQGLAHHLARLASGETRADVLVGVAESQEARAGVIGQVENGIVYVG